MGGVRSLGASADEAKRCDSLGRCSDSEMEAAAELRGEQRAMILGRGASGRLKPAYINGEQLQSMRAESQGRREEKEDDAIPCARMLYPYLFASKSNIRPETTLSL